MPAAAGMLLALALPPAFAQDAAEDAIEEVVVTGSNIKGMSEDTPLPVTRLTRDELSEQGAPTTLDLIRNLPFVQGVDGETDQFQGDRHPDRATVNIRGLGPSRSLVLINGRRNTWSPHATDAQAQLLVDVNMLPSIALERIEFLRDGATATYGSDAIAGVMNYITRSDFIGLEVSANHKFIDDFSGDTEAGAILGVEFFDFLGGGDAHITTSFGYIQRSELELVQRDWAVRPYAENTRGGWSTVGRPAVFVPWDRFDATPATLSGFSRLLLAGVVDPNCERLGGVRTTTLDPNPLGGFCRFQYTPFANLAEEAKRWQWLTELSWDLTDTTTLSAELLLTDSQVPAWKTSPSYPPNRLVDRSRSIRANNPGLIDMASKYPAIYGDYASCDASYCRWAGDGGVQDEAGIPAAWQDVGWYYGRSYGQDGPRRGHKQESELMRLAFAVDGELGDFGWNASASYSTSERVSLGGDTMVYRDARARQGLGGFECERLVPNEYDADGNLRFSLETLMANAGRGPCRYWIPFSNAMARSHPQVPNGVASNRDFNPALNNREILDYMLTERGVEGETSLLVLEGVLTGTVPFSLPGGDIDFAAGVQWRNESYASNALSGGLNDGLAYPCVAGPEIKDCTSGRTGLFGFLPPVFPIDADRNIQSIFGELLLPLLDSVEGRFSLRYENYGGNTGGSVDPKLALRWQATQSISLRTSLGTTFRGPTLNQTVAENSSNTLQYVGATGAFKRVDTKGNPDLAPEEATTFNVGLLVDRDDLLLADDRLFFTVDYWHYDFEKPLVTEPHAKVLAAACPGAATAPCDTASRYFPRLTFGGNATASDVEIIDVNIVNGPDIKTDGIDFTLRYTMPIGGSELTAGTTGTRVSSYDISAWELGPAHDALGRLNYGTSLARPVVEWKSRSYVNFRMGAFNVRYVANYIGAYDHLGPDNKTNLEVESQLTHELHGMFDMFDDKVRLWASIINITNEEPPFVTRDLNYDTFTHNPFGLMVKVGASASFGQ